MEEWLYLAVVIDLYSRKVVGWAMSSRIKASLVTDALSMAYWRRKPGKGLIHHSDRGSQYAGGDYRRLLGYLWHDLQHESKGRLLGHALAESFFHSLKTEWTADIIYRTRSDARSDVIRYIEMFYNSNRFHSYLEYKNPNDFEKKFYIG